MTTLALAPGWESDGEPLQVWFVNDNAIHLYGSAVPDHDPVAGEHIATLPPDMHPCNRFIGSLRNSTDEDVWTPMPWFSVETDGRILWYPPS